MFDRGTLSRRGFIQRSTLALTAVGMPLWAAREVVADDEDKKSEKKDEGVIKVGVIGIGSQGKGSKGSQMQSRARQLVNDVQGLKNNNIRFTAVCDVDARHLGEGVEAMKKIGHDVKPYKDYRELNDSKDVDVVFVATPDHWHALCAIDAMKKGKHVYCEKPLTLTVAEAEAIVAVQQKTNRVFQTGNQQRSDYRGLFRLACDLVRNGRIGKVRQIIAGINGNPQSDSIAVAQVPTGLDWNMWLGPTPETEYLAEVQKGQFKTNCHYDFRWWYTWSGGKMTDWGAHHIDVGQWALDMDASGPIAVEGKGTPPNPAPRSYSCHKDFNVIYHYADGTTLRATSEGDNGVRFVGDRGKSIFVSRSGITLTSDDPAVIEEPLPKGSPRLPVSGGHMRNFFHCLKTGEKPICHAAVGASSAIICHIGAIALRLGRKLTWDPKARKFGDDEANAMLSREYRAPWKLEV